MEYVFWIHYHVGIIAVILTVSGAIAIAIGIIAVSEYLQKEIEKDKLQ